MTGAIANLLLNILIVCLLAVTIAYCWRLNRRIRILQDGKGELAQLLKHFDESTQRASESIIALQTASKKIGETIQLRIDKANYLLDDLAFMIERGQKLANQMEAGFAVNRARSKVLAEQLPAAVEAPEPIKPVPVLERPSSEEEKPVSQREKTSASLEAVLERVVGRIKSRSAGRTCPRAIRDAPAARVVEAEQELLDMLDMIKADKGDTYVPHPYHSGDDRHRRIAAGRQGGRCDARHGSAVQ